MFDVKFQVCFPNHSAGCEIFMHSADVSGDYSVRSWASSPYASDPIQKVRQAFYISASLPFTNLACFIVKTSVI